MRTLYTTLALLILFACDDRKVDASKWKEELKTHQFVKVSNGEIAADVQHYSEKIIATLDSAETTRLSSRSDSVISEIEQRYKPTHKVKLCYLEQDDLHSCYKSVTTVKTVSDTTNKVAEIWEAYDAAITAKVEITNAPQFLLDGFYILYTHPVIAGDTLQGMWCMLYERKNIVLNRIE